MNQQPIEHHPATATANLVPDKPTGPPAPASARHVFKLGLDVDMHLAVTAIQCDHGAIKPAQKLTRPQLLKWVREQTAAGHAVHTVYEACGFGYTLHEELTAAGAQSLVTTPMCLSPERQRKNDRLDALALCVRLARHLDGHAHELRPIRIPTAAERERRELGRQREFWKRELRRLENHGRALRMEFEHATLPGNWAGPRKWKALALECSAFVRGQLDPVVAQIRACKGNMDQLTAKLEALVKPEEIPTGLGALTTSLLDGEVCDWHRFKRRKAVGSYTGCCPSEHSSGGVQVRVGQRNRREATLLRQHHHRFRRQSRVEERVVAADVQRHARRRLADDDAHRGRGCRRRFSSVSALQQEVMAAQDDAVALAAAQVVHGDRQTPLRLVLPGGSNAAGSVTSAAASLTLLAKPAITSQPLNQTVTVGGSTSFVVTANGSGTLTYQWLFNNKPLNDGGGVTGSRTAKLVLSNVQATRAGNYSVTVNNSVGAISSAGATLTVKRK